jgi:pyruvate formate lyase activating enzyme
MLNRREFCRLSGQFLIGVAAAPLLPNLLNAQPNNPYIRDARYFKKLDNNRVQCLLCPRQCIITTTNRGFCGVRKNQNGNLKTLIYGRLTAVNNDPIEKKPLFHFLPGTTALSVSTSGCNLKCKFCQNWTLSQSKPEELNFSYFAPEQLVATARNNAIPTIAYTYNEPTIFTEYILDTAAYGREQGIRSVSISAGYIAKQPLRDLCGVLDAIKIDFKAYSESFYKNVVFGTLNPVLDTLV